ncbi:MAG: class I SAM-dependent methyltransferase, partial [Bryobacteraceae bacterium]
TGEDYDEHMATVGQAQAAAALTAELIRDAELPAGSRLVVAGAGTGHMFDFLSPDLFQPFELICTDLNPNFLARLRGRLLKQDIRAFIFADDIERTALPEGPDFLLAVLLLEQIDWRKGVEAITALRPAACGIVIQENPAGMASAVTPGRAIPASMAAAFEEAQPKLVPGGELLSAFDVRGYRCTGIRTREVADGKRLVSMLLLART